MRKMYSKKQIEKMIENIPSSVIEEKMSDLINEFSEGSLISLQELVEIFNNIIDLLNSNEATAGEVLTATGDGDCEWNDKSDIKGYLLVNFTAVTSGDGFNVLIPLTNEQWSGDSTEGSIELDNNQIGQYNSTGSKPVMKPMLCVVDWNLDEAIESAVDISIDGLDLADDNEVESYSIYLLDKDYNQLRLWEL